ncbi:MFS general substrate transporter [Xylariomycetidae sp. FL0641]|nr:MFS general substrate transporter [Xylariomycetidae sp. FL0641]
MTINGGYVDRTPSLEKYATTRQKVCQNCSADKARCDRRPAGCTRYELEFTDLELLCPINAEDISNRWLNTYVPIPNQAVKEYPATIQSFIYRTLKSYASTIVRGRGCPPFIHALQTAPQLLRPPLATCLSLARICERPLAGSDSVATETLQREMTTLFDSSGAFEDDVTLLAAFQAYLLYSMILFFRLGQSANPFLRQAMMNLQQLACTCSQGGLVCSAEVQRARPRWEAWIVAEAKRRTLYTMYLFDSVLSAHDSLPTFVGTELRGLPAPSSKVLWQAENRHDWNTAYNIHLVDWPKENLRIDELWPIPSDMGVAAVAERRDRVDHWLEDVDEYGTMLFAVTNSTPTATEPYSIFDKRQKSLIVLLVSTAATFSGFASNIYFPALPTIARDLDVSIELVNLTVTSYLLFQGLAPSLWGPVSDVKGRRVAYCCTFLVFLGACIGLAETRNYATLVVLRCLQSTGSASTIAIGSGVIGDITTRAERGGFMGIFQAGLLVPVAVGPVIGGALAGSLGWRAIFWFLTIYSGVFLVLLVLLLPETLRSLVANGSRTPPSNPIAAYPLHLYQRTTSKIACRDAPSQPATAAAAAKKKKKKKRIDVLGPLRILASRQAAPIIAFLAVYYAVWQMSLTALSSLLASPRHYGLRGETQIGLTFLANGVGAMAGTLLSGRLLDADYRRVKAGHERAEPGTRAITDAEDDEHADAFPLERARLRLLPLFSLLQCASVLLFGWSVQFAARGVPLAVPLAATFFTGGAAVAAQAAVSTYLVDVFAQEDRSAAAAASLNLARCLVAAGGTAFVTPLVRALGAGGAFTLCVAVQLLALLGPAVQCRFAAAWRRQERQSREGRGEQGR